MAERLVGIGHTVHFFLTLDRCAGVVERVKDLVGKTVFHLLLGTIAGEIGHP